MIRLSALLWVALLIPAARGHAQQPARLSGKVVDARTGEGIGGAELRLGDDFRSTSPQGLFQYGSVRPGTLRLVVRSVGYVAPDIELELVPGEDQSITILLARIPLQLDSIEVTARGQASIGGADLVNRGPDLATALDGWAGLVVTRTGAGNAAVPQIRGSAPEEVLVMLDGFMVNDPYTGRADLSQISSRDVERLSLERGAQSARFGNRAIAGVISIVTRHTSAPEMSAGIGTFGALTARAAAGIGTASASVTVERWARDFVFLTQSGEEARRQNADGEVYSLNARLTGPVALTLRGSRSGRGLPGTSVNPTPAAHAEDHSLVVGARTGRLNALTASLVFLDSKAADSAPPPGFSPYDVHTQAWGASLAFAANRPLQIGRWSGDYSIGAEGRYDRFNGDAVQSGADFTRTGSAVSADLSRRGTSLWTVAAALRLDWWSGERAPLASGRADLHWSRRGTVLSAALGNGVTVPALADLLFREGVGVAFNPDLRPERVRWEAEAGVRQHIGVLGADVSAELRGFYGRVADMILWSATGGNQWIWRPDNYDVIRRGFEAALEVRLPQSFTITGSSTFSEVRYDTPFGAQVRYRPRFSHSAFATWAPGRWRATVRWNHLGTRFTTARGINPLPPIDLLNASLERRLGSMLSLRGEVRDLLDSRATYIAGYPTPGRSYHLSFNLELP